MTVRSCPALPDLPARLREALLVATLPTDAVEALAAHGEALEADAGDLIADGRDLQRRLHVVLRGDVQLRLGDAQGVRLGPGSCFGAGAGPHTQTERWQALALGPVAWLQVAAEQAAALRTRHPALAFHLAPSAGNEVAAAAHDARLDLTTTPVRALMRRAPITVSPTDSILRAAEVMREHGVSSVLLMQQDRLVGIVTDRDLRNRAVAAGLDTARAVVEIATTDLHTVEASQPAFEALMLMARHDIHHVPVLDARRVVGMVTTTDITREHSTSAVYLAKEIHAQTDVAALAAMSPRVKQLQRSLAAAGASAYSTGHIVTAITDAFTVRLLQLAEAAIGPAPVAYAWVAAGSQARNEQTARSDQDNCLILDDGYDEARHGGYFEALARFVNDGLHACGYVYCPGEMMAITPAWRQPLRRWLDNFRRWTEEPEPKALMLSCVFFDMRFVHGRASLLEDLRRDVLARTCGNRIFLAHMVGNALEHRPPLSLFGGIATHKHGEVRDAVDLKHNGIVPIVDLARVYALSHGHPAVNTHDRLMSAAKGREISERSAHDLRDALEFMSLLRIRHQASQLARGDAADNQLSLSELSDFERGQLKHAFGVVHTLQSVLAQRYR